MTTFPDLHWGSDDGDQVCGAGSHQSSSAVFSHSVMSDSLGPPGLQQARLHYLLEFTQTHVHQVGDAIQPSHPLPPPSPLALNLFQHQGLFQ